MSHSAGDTLWFTAISHRTKSVQLTVQPVCATENKSPTAAWKLACKLPQNTLLCPSKCFYFLCVCTERKYNVINTNLLCSNNIWDIIVSLWIISQHLNLQKENNLVITELKRDTLDRFSSGALFLNFHSCRRRTGHSTFWAIDND